MKAETTVSTGPQELGLKVFSFVWMHKPNLFLISDPICLWSGTVLTLVVSNKKEKDSIY